MNNHEKDTGFEAHMKRGMLSLYLLFELSKGELHGYELLKRLRARAALCPVKPKVGVSELYAILDRLEKRGKIEFRWSEDARRRKLFRLTTQGKKAVGSAKSHFSKAIDGFRTIIPELFSGSSREDVLAHSIFRGKRRGK